MLFAQGQLPNHFVYLKIHLDRQLQHTCEKFDNSVYPFEVIFTEDSIVFYYKLNSTEQKIILPLDDEFIFTQRIIKIYNHFFDTHDLKIIDVPYVFSSLERYNSESYLLRKLLLDFLYALFIENDFFNFKQINKIKNLLLNIPFIKFLLAKLKFLYYREIYHRLIKENHRKSIDVVDDKKLRSSKSLLKFDIYVEYLFSWQHLLETIIAEKYITKSSYWFDGLAIEYQTVIREINYLTENNYDNQFLKRQKNNAEKFMLKNSFFYELFQTSKFYKGFYFLAGIILTFTTGFMILSFFNIKNLSLVFGILIIFYILISLYMVVKFYRLFAFELFTASILTWVFLNNQIVIQYIYDISKFVYIIIIPILFLVSYVFSREVLNINIKNFIVLIVITLTLSNIIGFIKIGFDVPVKKIIHNETKLYYNRIYTLPTIYNKIKIDSVLVLTKHNGEFYINNKLYRISLDTSKTNFLLPNHFYYFSLGKEPKLVDTRIPENLKKLFSDYYIFHILNFDFTFMPFALYIWSFVSTFLGIMLYLWNRMKFKVRIS